MPKKTKEQTRKEALKKAKKKRGVFSAFGLAGKISKRKAMLKELMKETKK